MSSINNEMQIRLDQINKIPYFLIAEICEREKMS